MLELESKLFSLFEQAISVFFVEEAPNIVNGVSERNLCARLGLRFENLLADYGLEAYYADTEYNRKQNGEVKTMLDEHFEIVKIQCDLIIHSRGEIVDPDNLIAIEMKKAKNRQSEKDSDRKRLRTLTKESYDGVWSNDGITHPEFVCGYKLGIYLELETKKRECSIEFYQKGNKISERIERF